MPSLPRCARRCDASTTASGPSSSSRAPPGSVRAGCSPRSSAIARETGIAVGAAVAQPTERLVELSALLEALFAGPAPLLDRSDLAGPRPTPEQRFWLLQDLHALLERAAMQRSLMICIDDAQWADGGTVAALRALPAQLADVPIAWVIAARPLQESRPLATVLDQLSRDGATTITLGPLVGEPVAQMAADLLGAQPDDAVLELVDEAEGSPFLLVELLLGLFEEGRIRVIGGQAELIDRQLPNRVQEGMRERLDRLSDSAATVATVAASLAPTFSFGDLARTLGWQASSLLGPVDELLRANVLVESDEQLRFWHDITREAVRASVPGSARRALDRQAAEVLLEAGALPVEVAPQLAASAEPGDELAIATLLEAAQALLTSDPVTAAQFGRRALEIAPAQHPRRGEIVGNTAIALHIAGNSDEAIRVRRHGSAPDAACRAGGGGQAQHRRHVRDLSGDPRTRRATRARPTGHLRCPACPPPRLPGPQPRHRRARRRGAREPDRRPAGGGSVGGRSSEVHATRRRERDRLRRRPLRTRRWT